jgi:hypothetical protein
VKILSALSFSGGGGSRPAAAGSRDVKVDRGDVNNRGFAAEF